MVFWKLAQVIFVACIILRTTEGNRKVKVCKTYKMYFKDKCGFDPAHYALCSTNFDSKRKGIIWRKNRICTKIQKKAKKARWDLYRLCERIKDDAEKSISVSSQKLSLKTEEQWCQYDNSYLEQYLTSGVG